ncbi:MAG: replicative DNA helicase [Candidatus Saccharibacteria bacterium]|nr:replicative DNA helicase [Candidatus Saccharibacteria bacterium]
MAKSNQIQTTTEAGGKLPPQNVGAELSLLGSVLIDDEVMVDIADKISANDFYDPRHRLIYGGMVKLYQKHSPIDMLTLGNELRSSHKLEEIGGAEYLGELTNYVPSAAHAVEYANIVREAALRRNLTKAGEAIANMAYETKEDVQALLARAEANLYSVSEGSQQSEMESLDTLLGDAFEKMTYLQQHKDKLRGVQTGFKDLDKMTAGLQKSDLIILAARPAMGKSTLAQNIAYNVAMREKKGVLFFSLEMSNGQVIDRMVSEAAGVDSWNIRTGNLSQEDFSKISDAMAEMNDAPMFFDDKPGMTVMEMKTKAQRIAHKVPLGLVVVDYLQLMSGSKNYGDNRVQEISEISRGLKLMARELDVPVLALSQLSRSVEQRPDKRPMLSDLRESGSIEQDADIVMFVYREDYYNPDTERKHITDLIIGKHRNGPVGTVELYFHPDRLKFMSLEKRKS